jgi:hypothetical protein
MKKPARQGHWGFRRQASLAACRTFVITLLGCYCVGTLSARAIDCLSAPDPTEPGRWSWREIEGRKCWYKRVGAVPPKSEFIWPEHAKKAPLMEDREPSLTEATQGITATLPQIEVARVKIIDFLSAPNLRLSDGIVDLMNGFSLGSFHGIGGAWQIPDYMLPADTFEVRYGRW